MPFSLEDILEDFLEAQGLGKREWLESGYRFTNTSKSYTLADLEDLRRRRCIASKKWKRKNKAYFRWYQNQYRRGKYAADPEYRFSKKAQDRRCYEKRRGSEKLKAQQKRFREKRKLDPVRLAKKRESDKLSKRRRRARLKKLQCGSPGQAVTGGR